MAGDTGPGGGAGVYEKRSILNVNVPLIAPIPHMKLRIVTLACLLTTVTVLPAAGQPRVSATLPEPELNDNSWVMIEIWPEVNDISLSAYFLDFSYGKNKNLCAATKRVFDREAEYAEAKRGKKFSTYRICMSVNDAKAQGYIRR